MIVYTGGTFDIMHYGHVAFLKQCRRLAGTSGRLVVSLNTDEFIKEYKGRSPVFTFQERARSLMELSHDTSILVDEVIPNFAGADSRPAILKVKPTIIAIGSDWARKDYYKQMSFSQEWLDQQNIMLCYIPYTWSISTTTIKSRLNGETHTKPKK